MDKYNAHNDKDAEDKKPQNILAKQTQNPLNLYRGLESEKDKQHFREMMHRNIGIGSKNKNSE